MLVWIGRLEGFIAVIIIGREIAISALREWMARIGKSKSVAVSFLGKVKTVSQMTAIIMLLYNDELLTLSMHAIGTILIYVAAVLTLWSMIYYLRMALPHAMKNG
jgi:CDP-diacylglycerol--glycerol-3-phosphate 3-phosphatidyltransferase/cardiolipin synthase